MTFTTCPLRIARYSAFPSLRRREFYPDFLKPLAIGRLVSGVVHPSDSTAMAGGLLLSIFRPMHEQGCDEPQQDPMRRLIPHVPAVFDTWRLLGARRRTKELSAAAIVFVRHPVVRGLLDLVALLAGSGRI